jgi:6-phosphogluconolactonase
MASESLLDQVPIPKDNVHRIRGELDPAFAAQEYELALRSNHVVLPLEIDPNTGADVPRIDLFLLGMGEDGHTASLFPETKALQIDERLVVETWVEKLESWRVTQTFTMINAAAQILFLVAGDDKAETLQQVLQGPNQPHRFPAQNVQPWNGLVCWLIDLPAAAKLE